METTISVAENSLNLSLLKFKHFIKQNGILFDEIMIFTRLLSRGTTTAKSQLKILKTYDTFVQERATTESSSVLQELVEKENAANDILHNLTSRFRTLAQNILPPEMSQSVPGRDTSES